MLKQTQYSVTEAAEIIGCGARLVRWMIEKKIIKAKLVGGYMWMISRREVEAAKFRRSRKLFDQKTKTKETK